MFNDRNHFERHFANYVAQLGLPPPPLIMGTHIDVFLLFHAVYPKGFEEVCLSAMHIYISNISYSLFISRLRD